MRFSKKFKNILIDVKNEIEHLSLPSSSVYKEDYLFRNRISNSLFNSSFRLSEKQYYDFLDLRVSYSFYDDQTIFVVIYKNPVTDYYCIILAYRNQKSYYEVKKSFFINDLSFDYDSFLSSISVKNKLNICKDNFQLFKNLRILV